MIYIYILLCIIHLSCIICGNNFYRFKTKILLMPLLSAFYIFNTNNFSHTFLFAILFCWLGDIVIAFSVKSGMLMFGIGHILYSIYILRDIENFNVALGAVIGFSLLVLVISLYKKLYRYLPEDINKYTFIYVLVLSSMTFSCIYRFFDVYTLSTAYLMFGGILFLISDTTLSYQMFKKETKVGGFFVMLTYILAQTFLVFGCM